MTQKLIPLIADKGGIVNTSTGLTRFTSPGSRLYAAAKGSVEVFTRYLAKELGTRGIRANTIAPGASKGAPYFRNRFIDLVTYKLEDEVNVTEGVNSGLRKDAGKQFLGQAIVGLIEWWFINGMPFSPDVLVEHLGEVIERNL
nr:SDR family oxidoreductase [Clostridium beijerinckii]